MLGGWLNRWSALRRRGVLGINARNRSYVMRYNPRSKYPLVDDKLTTKRLALEAGLAVPELYGAVRFQGELIHLDRLLRGLDSFVIKPAHGSGGDGVLVITERRRGVFVKGDGSVLTLRDIEYFVSNILSGVHSLGGIPDAAMIEYRVRSSRLFDAISYRGVPDIRLLIFRGIPAMAMVRLPTRASDGKANLHQGAVGVGIALATGVTGHGVVRDQVTDEHPDFGTALVGLAIPDWETLLATGARCADLTGLGYCGVDLVLDETRGPMMLEVNARPGLAIQIANQSGLELRLKTIEGMQSLPTDIAERIALARELDGAGRAAPDASFAPSAPADQSATADATAPEAEPIPATESQLSAEQPLEPDAAGDVESRSVVVRPHIRPKRVLSPEPLGRS